METGRGRQPRASSWHRGQGRPSGSDSGPHTTRSPAGLDAAPPRSRRPVAEPGDAPCWLQGEGATPSPTPHHRASREASPFTAPSRRCRGLRRDNGHRAHHGDGPAASGGGTGRHQATQAALFLNARRQTRPSRCRTRLCVCTRQGHASARQRALRPVHTPRPAHPRHSRTWDMCHQDGASDPPLRAPTPRDSHTHTHAEGQTGKGKGSPGKRKPGARGSDLIWFGGRPSYKRTGSLSAEITNSHCSQLLRNCPDDRTPGWKLRKQTSRGKGKRKKGERGEPGNRLFTETTDGSQGEGGVQSAISIKKNKIK